MVRDSLEDKSILPQPKKDFLPHSVSPRREHTWTRFERKAYWFVFKATEVFPVPTGRVERGWCTIC